LSAKIGSYFGECAIHISDTHSTLTPIYHSQDALLSLCMLLKDIRFAIQRVRGEMGILEGRLKRFMAHELLNAE